MCRPFFLLFAWAQSRSRGRARNPRERVRRPICREAQRSYDSEFSSRSTETALPSVSSA